MSSCSFGLKDLFSSKYQRDCSLCCHCHALNASFQCPAFTTLSSNRHCKHKPTKTFYNFRLEHRIGGSMAKHEGEERLLLFRSDRPGAIAKIVYSSTPVATCGRYRRRNSTTKEVEKNDGESMVQAKIHVLDVKEPYRGFDLGSLLFTEAMVALRCRYMNVSYNYRVVEHKEQNGTESIDEIRSSLVSSKTAIYVTAICCHLDVEEDLCRYNKLVRFYEKLGCSVKHDTKIVYINNNDDEIYRRIPMHITLRPKVCNNSTYNKRTQRSCSSITASQATFLPVALCDVNEKSLELSDDGSYYQWILLEHVTGRVELRTTKGHCLYVLSSGLCKVTREDQDTNGIYNVNHENELKDGIRLTFQLIEVPYIESDIQHISSWASDRSLWVFQFCHEIFLSYDLTCHSFCCSKIPSYWQAKDRVTEKEMCTLMCCCDTPSPQHKRNSQLNQTIQFNTVMRARYLKFKLKSMSLRNALDVVKALPAYHFDSEENLLDLNLRTQCFRIAEFFRSTGHPDWIQLLGLVQSLGKVIRCIDNVQKRIVENDFKWKTSCPIIPKDSLAPPTNDFSLNERHADQYEKSYCSILGMNGPHIGLDNMLLPWTGSEYMYHMLKHNDVSLPNDGLKMIRLATHTEWHSNDNHVILANVDDEDTRDSVAEYYELLLVAQEEMQNTEDFSTIECDRLWECYYAEIAKKYNASGNLDW